MKRDLVTIAGLETAEIHRREDCNRRQEHEQSPHPPDERPP